MPTNGTSGSLTELTLPRRKELEDRARHIGLDPAASSLLQICCAEHDLDPECCTCLDLATAILGKSPGGLSEDEVLFLLGEYWVSMVLE
jgi:hypothetical protein